jgi:hypothetical protein
MFRACPYLSRVGSSSLGGSVRVEKKEGSVGGIATTRASTDDVRAVDSIQGWTEGPEACMGRVLFG